MSEPEKWVEMGKQIQKEKGRHEIGLPNDALESGSLVGEGTAFG